jgi:uncharacterized protein YybS (DUF2232 family)
MGGVLGAGLLSAALFAISLVLPFVFLLGIVAPVPLVLLRLRAGSTPAFLATALAVALVAGIFAPGPALLFLFAFIAPGLVIGHAMARGRGLVRGCAWAFALVFVEIALGLAFAGPSLEAGALAPFDELLSQKALGDLATRVTPEQLAEWKTHLTQWRSIMSVVYPAAFVICGALCVLANAVVLRAILARRDPGWLEGGEFEGLRAPSVLAFAFVLCGASVAFPPARPFAYNALLVLGFFFALQGLAVTAFYAHRLAGPPFLRVAVVLLVIVSPWPAQILALIGLFDLFFNFRKWAVPPEARQG